MSNPINVSVQQLKRAVTVREQIEALEAELAAILGGSAPSAAGNGSAKRGRKMMSAVARAKISAAQKARWAKQKKGNPEVSPKQGRRKMSAAARAKISAAASARWAAVKASNRKTLAKA
jgi:hypothetical protein